VRFELKRARIWIENKLRKDRSSVVYDGRCYGMALAIKQERLKLAQNGGKSICTPLVYVHCDLNLSVGNRPFAT